VSTTGEHPTVPEQPAQPTLPAVLWQLAALIFRREALMLVAAMLVLVLGGGVTVVYGQGYLDGGAAKAVAPIKAKVEATDRRIDALEQKFDNAEERNARRFEVLYNAVLERRPQPGAEALMLKDAGADGGR